jgi:Bacterial Ig-like domain (group 3)
VTFLDGQVSIGSSQASGGSASFSTSALAVGTHLLTASYSGDANDLASTSAPIDVTISFPSQSVILSGGVVNAASYAVTNGAGSPVAPGSLVAIFTTTLNA